jgi:hypothetical protein
LNERVILSLFQSEFMPGGRLSWNLSLVTQ